MSSYSTLDIHADGATRRELVALRPALARHARESGYADAVVDDVVDACARGEGTPALPVPATRELVEWIHAQRPDLKFAVDVGDEPDGDFGDWSAKYGLELVDRSATGPTREQVRRWMRIGAVAIAIAAVAFAFYRIRLAGF